MCGWWGGPPAPQPTPGRLSFGENSAALGDSSGMTFYRRRLPHLFDTEHPVFLTWRLHDSLPPHRAFPVDALTSGQAFAAMDRLLDEARCGSFYLRQPAIADMTVEAIQYNAHSLGHYALHASWLCQTMFICWLHRPSHCPN